MSEETVVTPDPTPAKETVPASEPEGVKSDSPPDKDVEGSSTEEGKEEPKPSLLDDIEKALAEEKGEKPPEKTPEVKPAEEKKPGDGQEEDPYLVPEDVKEGTKSHERFQSLVNDNKEKVSQLEGLNDTVSQMRETVKDAGLNPESFSDVMAFAKEFNTGDPKKALAMLDDKRNVLMLKIGEVVETPGPLDQFPDLKEKVENHDLSEADALKLAQAEVAKKQANEAQETKEAQDKDQTDYAASVKKYSDEVTAMEKQWKETDADYGSKKDILWSKLEGIRDQPPHLWPYLVKQSYDLISETVKQSGKPVNPESPMGKDPGPEGVAEPKSLLEAFERNIGVK